MNDVPLIVLLITGLCTVALVIARVSENRQIEQKQAEKEVRRAAASLWAGSMNSFNIESVCVVRGDSLNSVWKKPMQKIYTDPPPHGDRDFYIDNMPGKQFGYFKHPKAHPGFDWVSHVGKTVHDANVIEHKTFLWLNKASHQPMPKEVMPK